MHSTAHNLDARKVRWGILGTAHIARKNWKAILNSGNSVVTAVASRSLERSRQFIAECQSAAPYESAPISLGSYEELLASPHVDAVYVPLPTGLRKEWVVRAAEARKHIVCEKPCARNAAELREMIEACARNRVQFMDGVMFMHSRRLGRIREVLDDGASVGQIRRIGVHFSFCGGEDFFQDNIRLHSEFEPLGCLGDLGWYCIRFILWTMQWRLPREVKARLLAERSGRQSPRPVPTELSAELMFDGGVSAGFYCSFQTAHQQTVSVSGTKGHLSIDDFVLPTQGEELDFEVNGAKFEVRGCDFILSQQPTRISVAEHSNSHPDAQESNLYRNISNLVLGGQVNPFWPDIALKTQLVTDACLESARGEGRAVIPM